MRMSSSVISEAFRVGNDLIITFKNTGKKYRYEGAGEHLSALATAPSSGKYFLANVKGQYSFSEC